MSKQQTLDILKQAMLLEKRGKTFYQSVAAQTQNSEVQSFFEFMAEEENHIQILTGQFKAFKDKGSFQPQSLDDDQKQTVDTAVLNKVISEKISAASFEAAAVSAAMSMEERAIQIYSERANSAENPEEKKVYQWLATWEQSHLNMLSDIDRTITEKIWFDNKFWPF